MKLKKNYLIIGIIFLLVVGLFFIRFFIGGNEDNWVEDSRGVYIKHGNPSKIPDYVLEQKGVIYCALGKLGSFNEEINSQCLGICGNYTVDIVHSPRSEEDNLIANQCEDYRNGNVNHLIEIDKEGNIILIV